MGLLQEILTWTQTLPAWQSDAVARLLGTQTLSEEDLKDLFALLKSEHGIKDPEDRQPKPLHADQIPAPAEPENSILLTAIKNLKNVNAIVENHTLSVAPAGVTVIYGDNGSGKSGYSRVLKRACRARDQSEPILPNANLPAGQAGLAQASFEIAVGGKTTEVHWSAGKPAPAELSSLSLFDTRCARAYLDNEDDFSYVPYGLDVFEGLATVCKRLKSMVEAEHLQHAVNLAPFAPLQGSTAVGKLIGSLSAKTDIAQIDVLGSVTPEQLSRQAELDKNLRENNPKEKAAQLRLRARRLSTLAANATTKRELVGVEIVARLRELSDNYRAAQGAAALAAKQFKEKENLLPGTGGEVWRELFEAARKFAIESHPDMAFPSLSADSPCPLCQQPLAEGAARLLRFEEFIQQETEKAVQARRKALLTEYKPFVESVLSIGLDEVTLGEIGHLDAQLAEDTKAFELALTARREAVKSAIVSQNWDGTAGSLVDPAARLQGLANKLNADAEGLEQASDEKVRAALQTELGELNARVQLASVKESVKDAVKRLAHQARLARCLPSLRTNAISLKASELAEKIVSKSLEDALNREFKVLGVGTLHVSLQSRTDRGKALHKLKLQLPQSRSPSDVLSEGEQRAVAIASFLAEIALSGSTGGIVFDDPMSSLDHRRRERVARRLVAEAAQRQVIIFTHDIYFLALLVEEGKQAGVPVLTQSLNRRPEGFGVPDPELPFEGKNSSKRIGALKAQHQYVAKLYKDGAEEEHRKQTVDAYFRLRMAWERSIEEALLRQVVLRFRKGIETQRLAEVVVTDDDYFQVNAGMTKCSNYAHDKALLGGVAVPEPDELLQDITALEQWRMQLEKRSGETAKVRKAGPTASLEVAVHAAGVGA